MQPLRDRDILRAVASAKSNLVVASALVVLLLAGGLAVALWRFDTSQERYETALAHSQAMNAVGEARDEMLDTSAYVTRYMLNRTPADRRELEQ